MNKQDLMINLLKRKAKDKHLNFVETSARLETLQILLEGGSLPDRKTWDMWRDKYNHIADKAGLPEFPEYDDHKDYWNPVS